MTGEPEWPPLTLHLPEPRREELELKLKALKFESYQQFAEACATLFLSGDPAFLALVGQACHLEREIPQMSWTEPGKDVDE